MDTICKKADTEAQKPEDANPNQVSNTYTTLQWMNCISHLFLVVVHAWTGLICVQRFRRIVVVDYIMITIMSFHVHVLTTCAVSRLSRSTWCVHCTHANVLQVRFCSCPEWRRTYSVGVADRIHSDMHRIQRGTWQCVALPVPLLQIRRRYNNSYVIASCWSSSLNNMLSKYQLPRVMQFSRLDYDSFDWSESGSNCVVKGV